MRRILPIIFLALTMVGPSRVAADASRVVADLERAVSDAAMSRSVGGTTARAGASAFTLAGTGRTRDSDR